MRPDIIIMKRKENEIMMVGASIVHKFTSSSLRCFLLAFTSCPWEINSRNNKE